MDYIDDFSSDNWAIQVIFWGGVYAFYVILLNIVASVAFCAPGKYAVERRWESKPRVGSIFVYFQINN